MPYKLSMGNKSSQAPITTAISERGFKVNERCRYYAHDNFESRWYNDAKIIDIFKKQDITYIKVQYKYRGKSLRYCAGNTIHVQPTNAIIKRDVCEWSGQGIEDKYIFIFYSLV